MRNLFRSNLFLLLIVLVLFIGAGCGAGSDAPDLMQPEAAVESEESEYIVGRWEVNDGRFGHKIFDFQEEGRLLLADVASGETVEMSYTFVGDNSLVISGDDRFNGAATVKFYEDKMDLMVNFKGAIYGELYVFARVPDPVK